MEAGREPDAGAFGGDTVDGSLRFSIVSAVYDVARYLDDFIASVEAQDFPRTRFEVVVVDDGSTDDSLSRLRTWSARSRIRVVVITKDNGGQSTARNLGLEHASGEWVTFLDPDDAVAPDYLSQVDAFLGEHPRTTMIATRRLMWDESAGVTTDTHPLRSHFRGGNRVRVLSRSPRFFHGSAPAAFFRRAALMELGLRFDPRVRPNFEDGHFCCRYLLSAVDPTIGFVATATYSYRKRADSSSTLNRSLLDPDRYTTVLERGYLALLRRSAAARPGSAGADPWLQTYVIYELSWYFTTHDSQAAIRALPPEVNERFHALMDQICDHLDPRLVEEFRLREIPYPVRMILAHGYGCGDWRQSTAVVDRYDPEQVRTRIRYLFTGAVPIEVLLSDDEAVRPTAAKTRTFTYYGRVLVSERVLWAPSRRVIRLEVDGRPLDLEPGPPRLPRTMLEPRLIKQRLGPPRGIAEPDRTHQLIVRLSRQAPVARLFRDAWVVMDRIHVAGDSGEILFRYLRRRRRGINAWFVVEAGSPDYRRLRAEGYRRIVGYGSMRWKMLMLNATHLISSDVETAVVDPGLAPLFAAARTLRPRFTFLQHGVSTADLSRRLNDKPIDLMVTSTRAEYASIAGDDTGYLLTEREVRLTGLPRFDRLAEIGRAHPEDRRDLVLITPTGQEWLLSNARPGEQRPDQSRAGTDSEVMARWRDFLGSAEVTRLCREQSLTLALLPPPDLADHLDGWTLPDQVRLLTDGEVGEYLARSAVLLTDYSPVAFDAAYLDRPVVYIHFDTARALSSGRIRAGYFDYERDGFGPVAHDVATAIDRLRDALRGRRPVAPYAERMVDAFPDRDGRCSRRVTDAILDSVKPVKPVKIISVTAGTGE